MDPFVPEPEERLAHQEAAAASAKPRNSDYPPPSENGLWPGGLREQAKLLIPLAVIIALMLIQYGVQSSSINRLESELAALKTIKTSPASTAGSSDNSPLPEVQQELSEQADLIRTLEQRIATQIIDLDNLRSSIGGKSAGSSTTSATSSAEVDLIRKNLQTMETRLTTLGGQVEKSLAASNAPDKRVADLEKLVQSQFDSSLEAVSKQAAEIGALEQKLSRQIAATDKAVAETRQQLASLGKTVDLTAAANGDSGKTLTETRKALDNIEAKLAAMTAEMDAALARLQEQETAIKAQQSIVNNNGSNPFAEQIARQIDDKLAPQAETLKSQASLVKTIEATLAEQVAEIDGLRDTSAKLNDQISATRTTLEQTLQSNEGAVGADQLDALTTAVKLEVSGLNRELEGAIAKISQQETQLAQWRTDFENRLTSNQTDSKPGAGGDFNQLQGQLASQLDDMKALRTANAQLADDIASTRQQLDNLRKTIITPVTHTPSSAIAEADLLAVQSQMDDLTRTLESSTRRLSSQEKTFNEWQLELESRLANHERALAAAKPASSPAASDTSVNLEIDSIKRTIAALKKQHPFVKFPKE